MSARYLVGDVFERLAELPDGSIDLVLTSPPFLALRSYLPADHPEKAKEIGSEPTPAEFLDTLLRLTAEWRRVLAPHGSIAVELGDSYAGSGGAGGDYADDGLRAGQERFDGSARRTRADGNGKVFRGGERQRDKRSSGWPLDKSLCGIPHLYHLSLAYGRNVLRAPLSAVEMLDYFDLIVADLDASAEALGSERVNAAELLTMMRSWLDQRVEYGPTVEIEPWRVRNVVAWCRPNPPVGALGDKFGPATSYMTVATVARDRYFDLDAVRVQTGNERDDRGGDTGRRKDKRDGGGSHHGVMHQVVGQNPAGAPPLDWWEIPTQPYSGAHYATWPMALCKRPIEAMVPQRVCTVCGEPSRRIAETTNAMGRRPPGAATGKGAERNAVADGSDGIGTRRWDMNGAPDVAERLTLGWTDCGHGSYWRRGVVLDPFAGSGTTLAVATGLGRDAIGIDLDPRNVELARERVGMFLEVNPQATEGAA